MMRFLCLALLGFMTTLPAWAGDVTVRSGEHPSFSRVAFDFQEQIPWEIDQQGQRVSLRFDAEGMEFDTRLVFSRISGKRIRDVQVGANGKEIVFELNCECAANGFWHDRKMLVVDFRDTDPSKRAEAVNEVPAQLAEAAETPKEKPQVPSVLQGTNYSSRRGTADFGRFLDMPQAALNPQTEDDDKKPPESLRSSQQQLVQQLGRAASQGLLSPTTRFSPSVRTQDIESDAEPVPTAEDIVEELSANLHINVQSSIDQGFLDALSEDETGSIPQSCLSDTRVDVSSWGTEAPYWEQVGPLNGALSKEFDETDHEIAKTLAKKYIYFGFGLEARQVLTMLPQDGEDVSVLRALAEIMSDEPSTSSVLADQLDCQSSAALWSALSRDELPKDSRMDTDSILRSFAALPKHLRAYLGPRLSRRFLEADLVRESSHVLRILNRIDETTSPGAALVQAEIDLSEGKTEDGEAQLDAVLNANQEPSVDALIERVDSLLRREEPVSYDLAQLAAAYAFEFSGHPREPDLMRIHVMSLGGSMAFEAAYKELQRYEATQKEELQGIRSELFALLVKNADDTTFLKYAIVRDRGDAQAHDAAMTLAMAERLFALGFTNEASDLSSQPFDGVLKRDAKILRAKIALSQGLPRGAEVELLGLTGTDINALRAQARSLAGEHAQAAEFFASAGMMDKAEREAWLAKDWSDPAPQPSETTDDDLLPPGVLEQNRSLIADAGQTRDSLDLLLQQAPMPEFP